MISALRRITLLLAMLAVISAPTGILDSGPPVIVADEGKDESGQDDDDDNRGHGNDDDGHDEDNPGEGEGNEKDNDKKDEDRDGDGPPVETVAPYSVEVTCEHDAETRETTCIFTGVAPDGGSDVSHIDVPEETVCAEVTGGDYEYVDPDPNTRVTGYKSRGSEGELTLVIEGDVVTGDPTTYWIKAGDGVFPAEGPGLVCDLAADETTGDESVGATFESTPAPETGSLAIRAYTCSGMPDDSAAFDWFGECDPAGSGVRFTIASVGTSGESIERETGEDGAITIDDLAAGSYTVDLVEGSWCHAKSDSVNANSEVIVESGSTSTVWIFTCVEVKSGA